MRVVVGLVLMCLVLPWALSVAGEVAVENILPKDIVAAVPRTITYQGILKNSSGDPVVEDSVNATFRIYDDPEDGNMLWESLLPIVTNEQGYFIVALKNLYLPFNEDYYLELQVQGELQPMIPRQKLTMAAYAAYSDTSLFAFSSGGGSRWTVTDSVLYTNAYWGVARGGSGNAIYGTNGHTMINLGVACTTGVNGHNYMYSTVAGGQGNVSGNSYSVIGGGFVNTASGLISTVSGGGGNVASGNGSAVGGGGGNAASGLNSAVGGGYSNLAGGQRSTVAGGESDTTNAVYGAVAGGALNIAGNTAEDTAAFVGGGYANEVTAKYSLICGGTRNYAEGLCSNIAGGHGDTTRGVFSGVAAGYHNVAGDASWDTAAFVGGGYDNASVGKYSVVGGGRGNHAGGTGVTVGGGLSNTANGSSTVVCGGSSNTVSGSYGTVCGGYSNTATGSYSAVCGGYNNNSNQTYSAILCGANNFNAGQYSTIVAGAGDTLESGANYSMVVGWGVRLNTDYRIAFYNSVMAGRLGLNRDDDDGGISYPIHVGTNTSNGNGAHLTNGGVWTDGSSRAFKENFQPLDAGELLRKISGIPIESWNYKGSTEKHIGPVAEDFVGVFDVGVIRERDGQRDDQYLAAKDVAGVALAGVKELLKKIEALEQENTMMKAEIAELKDKLR